MVTLSGNFDIALIVPHFLRKSFRAFWKGPAEFPCKYCVEYECEHMDDAC